MVTILCRFCVFFDEKVKERKKEKERKKKVKTLIFLITQFLIILLICVIKNILFFVKTRQKECYSIYWTKLFCFHLITQKISKKNCCFTTKNVFCRRFFIFLFDVFFQKFRFQEKIPLIPFKFTWKISWKIKKILFFHFQNIEIFQKKRTKFRKKIYPIISK